MTKTLLGLAVVVALGAGCTVLPHGEPLTVRYFDPEPVVLPPVQRAASGSCALTLGQVNASADLGQEIARRKSTHEITYDEGARWSESPDAYLRRALARGLFESGGCARILSGPSPVLDAELTRFEDDRGVARVAVHALLARKGQVLFEGSFDAERPVNAGDLAQAMSLALGEAAGEVVARVTRALTITVSDETSPTASPPAWPEEAPDARGRPQPPAGLPSSRTPHRSTSRPEGPR